MGEKGTRHLQAVRTPSVVRWLVGKKKKMPPISPPDSWKMSRMSQHSAVWVGSCVCAAPLVPCFQGQSSLQEGHHVLGVLRASSEDRLLQPCQKCSPASVSACRAGVRRCISGYIWDNESESPGGLTAPSALLELPWPD